MVNALDIAEETAALRWRDPAGRVHAVEGAEVLPGKTLRWTRCGLYDLAGQRRLAQRGGTHLRRLPYLG